MCKQISTEYVLGSVLYYRPDGISLSELNIFERNVYNHNEDLIIDVSKNAIISVMESCEEYFKLENDSLFLKDFYLCNMIRIRNRFVDVLDDSFKTDMKKALFAGDINE